MRLSIPSLLSLRLLHQRLAVWPMDEWRSPATAPAIEQVLDAICGVQAQDLLSGELSASVRAPLLTLEQVQARRNAPGGIVRTWCMRGTLHLVSARDACWLVPLFGPRSLASDRRRMAQLGWDEPSVQRASGLVLERLAGGAGLTRPEIIRLLAGNGLPYSGQAPIHLIARLANEGRLIQGPDRPALAGTVPLAGIDDPGERASAGPGDKSVPTFVSFESWAGALQPLAEDTALAELARRYLAAYAPASPQDFAAWSGLNAGEARRAWQLLGDELAALETEAGPMWVLAPQLDVAQAFSLSNPIVRLLPRFDIYLLGYTDRRLILAPEFERLIFPGGGILAASLLVAGRLAGAWSYKASSRDRRSRLQGRSHLQAKVTLSPFEPLPASLSPFIEQEVQRLGHFLGCEAQLKTTTETPSAQSI